METASINGLRRQRYALALAVALGDLAGELTLEEVTGLLSAFADRAIDEAVQAATPGARRRMPSRKASQSSRWASSAAASSIIRPTSICSYCSIPKPCRGAAVTIRARLPSESVAG